MVIFYPNEALKLKIFGSLSAVTPCVFYVAIIFNYMNGPCNFKNGASRGMLFISYPSTLKINLLIVISV